MILAACIAHACILVHSWRLSLTLCRVLPCCSPPAWQASVEPPWPGLCSQPGANLDDYHVLHREIVLLSGAVYALKAACGAGQLADMAAGTGMEAQYLADLRTALARGLGLAAATCAGAAGALAHMPAFGPCYGECPAAPAARAPALAADAATPLIAPHLLRPLATPCLTTLTTSRSCPGPGQAPTCPGARWTLPPGPLTAMSWLE